MADIGKISVIGIGPGNIEYLTPVALRKIRSADILVSGERGLEPFLSLGKEHYLIKNNLPQMVKYIEQHRFTKTIAVLASGDPGFYGILNYLKRHFKEKDLDVVPGISSIQLACARLCISWEDAVFFSAHGRSMEGLGVLAREGVKMILLTDGDNSPAKIAQLLLDEGIRRKRMHVCEHLSYENERIHSYPITEVPNDVGTEGCVVVVTDE